MRQNDTQQNDTQENETYHRAEWGILMSVILTDVTAPTLMGMHPKAWEHYYLLATTPRHSAL
jgi:hypothetical protein